MSDIEPQGQHPGGGHETTDVGLRGIFAFAVILVVFSVAVQIGLGLWMGAYSRRRAGRAAISRRSARE